jgi:hypothetical protein
VAVGVIPAVAVTCWGLVGSCVAEMLVVAVRSAPGCTGVSLLAVDGGGGVSVGAEAVGVAVST